MSGAPEPIAAKTYTIWSRPAANKSSSVTNTGSRYAATRSRMIRHCSAQSSSTRASSCSPTVFKFAPALPGGDSLTAPG
ncbi:Uncharacterised protein [Mycobacteroides abscessus subsp. abscessus]|nr:Uncharacterised protein [Mycobacteroides abscessus subsp. abscessus]